MTSEVDIEYSAMVWNWFSNQKQCKIFKCEDVKFIINTL